MKPNLQIAWSAPVTDFDEGRDTADPLGFRGWANQLARDIVPGLTQVTWRTRGYSLLCKGLQLVQTLAPRREVEPVEAFLRFERLWVGAQRAVHGKGARWAGVRMADVLLADDAYRLDKPLTSQQLSSGIWGGYRRSATAFGLIRPSGSRSGPSGYKLTKLGSEMASAITMAAFSEKVRLAQHTVKKSLPVAVLRSLISRQSPGEQPSSLEVELLSRAMLVTDRSQDNALQCLRAVFDRRKRRPLELVTLAKEKELSEVQRRAAIAASELLSLMLAIEAPYRLWVTGSSVKPIPQTIWRHPGWETIRRWPVPELVSLHDNICSPPKGATVFETIHQHHERLMESRGAEPWERDIDTPARRDYQAPDFCLQSASLLFAEGVLQGAHS